MAKKDKWDILSQIIDYEQYTKNFGQSYQATIEEQESILTAKQYKQYQKATKKWFQFWR